MSQRSPRLLLVYPATHKLGWVRRFQLPPHSLQQVAAVTPPPWEIVLADETQGPIPLDEPFDLVGITAMTHQAVRAYEIADRFRAAGVPVVLGGIHPTVLPEEAAEHADAVVVGEAEPVWARLLADLRHGQLERFYRAPYPTEEWLSVPPPRRDILAGNKYLTTQTIQISRGCPYECPFCTVSPYFGRTFRYRTPGDILAEIGGFRRKLVVFLDDNILGDPAKARPVLEGMAERGFRWGSQTSLRFAEDDELLRLVARSGCVGLFIGLESVSGPHSTLPKVRSRYSQADLMKRVRDAGIIVEASIIFGFDDHDEGIFERTARFLEQVPCMPTFNILTPYPGTALFRQFQEEGRLLHTDWQRYNHSEVVYRPRQMSPERLYRGWMEARMEAYRWPAIFSRVAASPGFRMRSLAYNILRRGGNDRLEEDARELRVEEGWRSPGEEPASLEGEGEE